jgi:hypothetical protein
VFGVVLDFNLIFIHWAVEAGGGEDGVDYALRRLFCCFMVLEMSMKVGLKGDWGQDWGVDGEEKTYQVSSEADSAEHETASS